jgi:DNA-binding MarR family transcriptional regulator
MLSSRSSKRRRNLITELSERIGRELATKTVLFHQAVATRLGLNATDLKCLDLLRQTQTPLTAANLAALTGLTGGAITGVADRLEAAGFVERVRDRADRRRWELRPKPDCQHEIGALLTPLTDAMAMLCADYDDGELQVISGFLTEVTWS